MIILTPGKRCKCTCRRYVAENGENYWIRKGVVYLTDCHKKKEPKKAKGIFKIMPEYRSVRGKLVQIGVTKLIKQK